MNLDAVRKKLQNLQTKTQKQDNLWKPETGNQTIRIVPNKTNPEFPFHELNFHYGLGGKNYISPSSYGRPDPLVEFAEKLKSTGSKEDWLLSRQITPKLRIYVPIIVRGKESEGVKFWGFGKTVYTELLGFLTDPDYGDITDPRAGRDISIEFTPAEGAGSYPKTSIRVKPNQTPVTNDPAVLELIQNQPLIDDIFKEPDYATLNDALQAWLNGESGETNNETTSEANTNKSVADTVSNQTHTPKVDDVGTAFDNLFNQ
jgi:hypothetical protein